jgi:hypothetical protein
MQRWSTLMAVSLVCASATLADDKEPTWDLHGGGRSSNAGDRFVCEGRDSLDYTLDVRVGERRADDLNDDSRTMTTYRFVREILAAADGKKARARNTIERWENRTIHRSAGPTRDEKPDTCLEGKTISVEDDEAKLEGGTLSDLSRSAQDWVLAVLVRREVSTDDSFLDRLLARERVKSGQGWSLDPNDVRRAIQHLRSFTALDENNVDYAASVASGTLAAVSSNDRGRTAHFQVGATLPSKQFRLGICGNSGERWSQGGKVHVTVKGAIPVESGTDSSRAVSVRVAYGGKVRTNTDQGVATIDAEVVFESESTETAVRAAKPGE